MLRQPTLDQLRATAGLLKIPIKDGARVDTWVPNSSQEHVGALLVEGESVVIVKLRQEGITSITCLWLILVALMNPGLHFAIVLQDAKKAAEKLDLIKDWLAQLGIARSALEVNQAQRIRLPGGSEIHALSARSGEAEGEETAMGRSGSYAAAVLDEAAYYANDKALPAIKAAVGRGQIVVCSTASGPDGVFARLVLDADKSTLTLVFLGVEQSSRCVLPEDSITNEEWNELRDGYGFTSRAHAAWWFRELHDVGGDVLSMLREYPVRLEDPFRLSESRWIQTSPGAIEPKTTTAEGLLIYEHRHREAPREARYIVSVDVAEGVGGDYSALWVIERATHEVVAGWASNTDETDVLAQKVRLAHAMYRPDVVLIEKNGVGVAAVKEARRLNVNVVEVVATEADKYAKLLAAKRYVEARRRVPELLVEESGSLRVKLTKLGKYQWIGRKDGLIALGQGLEWLRLNPWQPEKPLNENVYADFLKMHGGQDSSGYARRD